MLNSSFYFIVTISMECCLRINIYDPSTVYETVTIFTQKFQGEYYSEYDPHFLQLICIQMFGIQNLRAKKKFKITLTIKTKILNFLKNNILIFLIFWDKH